jgi:hypothetical protein
MPGAYANTFALTEAEKKAGFRLFTGERVTNAAARHIAGEECCRALRLMKTREPVACKALDEATAQMARGIGPASPPQEPKPDDGQVHWLWPYRGGTFCCGQCSVSVWRNILAGSFDHPEERLSTGLRCLKVCRRGDSQWRVFPFWYTLLALVEMELPAAVEEMRYAAPAITKFAAQKPRANATSIRRHELTRRILARI